MHSALCSSITLHSYFENSIFSKIRFHLLTKGINLLVTCPFLSWYNLVLENQPDFYNACYQIV